jgi:hypothetical protein
MTRKKSGPFGDILCGSEIRTSRAADSRTPEPVRYVRRLPGFSRRLAPGPDCLTCGNRAPARPGKGDRNAQNEGAAMPIRQRRRSFKSATV